MEFQKGQYSEIIYTAKGLVNFVNDHTFDSLEEKLYNIEVTHIESGLAVMHTEYEVFLDGRKASSGKEVYSMDKRSDGWKIVSIVFIRRLH